MFEKFTDKARRVMTLAQEEARSLGQLYVGTEHLLLGLIREKSGAAAEALSQLEVSYKEVLEVVKELAEKSDKPVPGGHIPFTIRSKRVLENAYRESLSRGESFIGTEHLLLGIVREGNGVAMDVLSRLGVSAEVIRSKIAKLTGAESENSQPVLIADRGRSRRDRNASMLAEYGSDLTKRAEEGELDPVIGRDNEIERVVQVLARRQKNNPLILGDPGVGKTAIAEGLAQLISSGRVPEILRGKSVWTLDLASMIAGAKFRGEFEDRLRRVIREVVDSKSIILFVDEIHTLVGAGSAEGALDAASILKPPLARGQIQIIGATTEEEYRKHLSKDGAFERRFQPVHIGEPSVKDAVEILRGLKSRYEEHHRVNYTDEALESAAVLADRYIQDRLLPDKAIDVIDEAGARKRTHKVVLPPELLEVDQMLVEVREQKAAAAQDQEFERAAALRDKERYLNDRRHELEELWRQKNAENVVEVSAEDVADVVSSISGVPVSSLTETEAAKLLRSEEVLHKRVIGQNQAVSAVARAMRRSRSPLKDPRRPGGSFIFLGPTGVGKTELAKTLAEFLFGSSDAMISFDMSEFMERFAVSKLVGAPPGYVGYDAGGELTKAVRRRPYSVLLFDEIEKAHPDVFNILLQVLDEGRLTDAQGRVVDFSNTVVIMTSNAGAREIASDAAPMGFSTQQGLDDKTVESRAMTELKKIFRPEFLNRVDEIVVFHPLKDEELRQITALMTMQMRRRLATQGLGLEFSEQALGFIAKKGYDPVYGARPLRRALQTLVEDPLSEKLLEGLWSAGDKIMVELNDEGSELVFKTYKGAFVPLEEADQLLSATSDTVSKLPKLSSFSGTGHPGGQMDSSGTGESTSPAR